MNHPKKLASLASIVAAGSLVLAGCSGDDGGESKGSLTIGAVPGWTDGTGTAYLYKHVLEENGYDVDVEELGDNALVYSGVAQGQLDLFGSAWIDRTQLSYWEEYGDSMEDLGSYYDDARLFLAVPEYSEMESIEDIPDHAAELENQIIGIEPGAGLTLITEEEVMPHYGLDGNFELVQSSTAAMISEMENALNNEREIVVTLWTPFWAEVNYPVRELEDPDGIYGEAEALHTVGRDGFAEDFPEVAAMVEEFSMTDEEFASLEDTMVNEFEGSDDEAAVEAWMEENPEFVDNLAAQLDG